MPQMARRISTGIALLISKTKPLCGHYDYTGAILFGVVQFHVCLVRVELSFAIYKRVKAKSRYKRYGDGQNQVRCNPFTSKDKRNLNRYGKGIEQKNVNSVFDHFL
jgi:hypothetical protein